jgi:hypothetical protein
MQQQTSHNPIATGAKVSGSLHGLPDVIVSLNIMLYKEQMMHIML